MAYQPTTNFGWAMPRGGDQAQISVINQMFTAKADEIVYQTRRMIAPGYIDDGSKTYQPGEIVEYENVDYVCTGTTSGAWDSSKWDATDMATQIQEAKASGGTEVIANPSGSATADLEKLSVAGTIYGIPDPTVTKEVESATGTQYVEFSDGADAPLVKCTTAITGSQDLHGYDKPWVGGAGKNKVNPNTIQNGYYTTEGYVSDNEYRTSDVIPVTVGQTYVGSIFNTSNLSQRYDVVFATFASGNTTNAIRQVVGQTSITIEEGEAYIRIRNRSDTISLVSTGNYAFQLELGSTATTFAPYSNICPITAYDQSTISVKDENEVVQQTSTATFSNSIYQGNADFIGGGSPSVQCDWPCIDLGDLTWDRGATNISGKYRFYANLTTALQADTAHLTSVCETYGLVSEGATFGCANGYTINSSSGLWVYDSTKDNMTKEEFKSSVTGVKLAYTLATPTTSSITPTNLPLKSLFGYSRIESTTGEMEVEYIKGTYQPIFDLIPEGSGGDLYSTTPAQVGEWIDGSAIMRVALSGSWMINTGNGSSNIDVGSTYAGKRLLKCTILYNNGYDDMAVMIPPYAQVNGSGYLNIIHPTNTAYSDIYAYAIILEYIEPASRSLSKGPQEVVDKVDETEEKKEEPEEEEKVDESQTENAER